MSLSPDFSFMEDLDLFHDFEELNNLPDDGPESLPEMPDLSETILNDASLGTPCETSDPPSNKAPSTVIKLLFKQNSDDDLLKYLTGVSNGKACDNSEKEKKRMGGNKTANKNGTTAMNRKPNIVIRCQNIKQEKSFNNNGGRPVNGTLSKNALLARENRQKKKQYIEDLKKNVEQLQTENKSLNDASMEKEELIKSLQRENAYLKSVLANVNEISSLLTSVKKTPGLTFTTSLLKNNSNNKRKTECESEKVSRSSGSSSKKMRIADEQNKKSADSEIAGGVCLHISSGQVSLEFCPSCSINAGKVWES